MDEYREYKKKRMPGQERLAAMEIGMLPRLIRSLAERIHEDRAKQIPYFQRDMAMVAKRLEGLYKGLLETTVEGTAEQIERQARHYDWQCMTSGQNRDDGSIYISMRDLQQFATVAVSNECAHCMKTGNETAMCPLRKLLRKHMDEPEPAYKGECGYSACEVNQRY